MVIFPVPFHWFIWHCYSWCPVIVYNTYILQVICRQVIHIVCNVYYGRLAFIIHSTAISWGGFHKICSCEMSLELLTRRGIAVTYEVLNPWCCWLRAVPLQVYSGLQITKNAHKYEQVWFYNGIVWKGACILSVSYQPLSYFEPVTWNERNIQISILVTCEILYLDDSNYEQF